MYPALELCRQYQEHHEQAQNEDEEDVLIARSEIAALSLEIDLGLFRQVLGNLGLQIAQRIAEGQSGLQVCLDGDGA